MEIGRQQRRDPMPGRMGTRMAVQEQQGFTLAAMPHAQCGLAQLHQIESKAFKHLARFSLIICPGARPKVLADSNVVAARADRQRANGLAILLMSLMGRVDLGVSLLVL